MRAMPLVQAGVIRGGAEQPLRALPAKALPGGAGCAFSKHCSENVHVKPLPGFI